MGKCFAGEGAGTGKPRSRLDPEAIARTAAGQYPDKALNRRERRAIAAHQRHQQPDIFEDQTEGETMTKTTERASPNRLAFPQQLQLHKTLEALLVTIGEGVVAYRDEWTDESVARSMPFDCTGANVQGLRTQMFGELRKTAPGDERIARLEVMVAALCKQLGITPESLAA